MCVVQTLTFDLLFAFLVLGHGRRQLLWFEVTRHPTAEWLARQITEAFPWTSAPAYLVRDNDRALGIGDGHGARLRKSIGGWRNADINGVPLRMDSLSTKLTRVAGYPRNCAPWKPRIIFCAG